MLLIPKAVNRLLDKGREEGHAVGREEGRAEGREEGRAERDKRVRQRQEEAYAERFGVEELTA